MGDKTRGTQGRMPVSGLIKVGKGKRRRTTRNWGAAFVAASVAVAWTVGGLVMPSMAAEPAVIGKVHPEVNISGGGTANVSLAGQNTNLYYAALSTNLFTTIDRVYAQKMYGKTEQLGDFTAQYLPRACFVRDDRIISNEPLGNFIRMDEGGPSYLGRRYGAWVLYPNGSKSFSVDSSKSRSADRSVDSPSDVDDADDTEDTLKLTLDKLSFDDVVGDAAAAADKEFSDSQLPNEKTGKEQKQTAESPVENPKESLASKEGGETQAKDVPPNGSESSSNSESAPELAKPTPAETSTAETEPKETKKPSETKPSSQFVEEKGHKAGNLDKESKSLEDRSAVSKQGKDSAENSNKADKNQGKDRSAVGQDRAVLFSAFQLKTKELKVKFDPQKSKDKAIEDVNKQVDEIQKDALQQLDEFVTKNRVPQDIADKFRTKLNIQFENMRRQAVEFLEKKYAKGAIGADEWRNCQQSGPIVPDGSLVLVNEARLDNHNKKAWYLGVKQNDYTISRLLQYASEGSGNIKADGADSFCVEPLKGLQPGAHNIYTHPSTLEWAQNHPERAELVKALAWHYKQFAQPKEYAKYQNAIWSVVMGLPSMVGSWDGMKRFWVSEPGSSAGLISAAESAYKTRPSVVQALKSMHLDQISVDTAPDGKSKVIFLQLNDYDKSSEIRRAIGNSVYLRVTGATTPEGKPVDRVSLEEAERGVHFLVKNQDQFSVAFAGTLNNAQDAYFLDKPSHDTQAQVTVLSKKITVSGSLKIQWGTTASSDPQVGTTVLVNGNNQNPGGPETVDISKYGQNDTITLTDSVTYSGLAKFAISKDNYYLVGKLKRVRDGKTIEMPVRPMLQDIKDIPAGSFQGIFPVQLKVSDMKAGDKYYYEEYILTTDPRYEKNKKVESGWYGPLSVVVSHEGENPDQTVKVKGSNAKLLINKIGAGESAKAKGNVTFDVYCKKDNKPTTMSRLYAPAAGGPASTNGAEPATELVVVPGSNCQVTETYSSQDVTFTDKDAVSFKAVVLGNHQQQQIPAPASTTVDQDGHRLRAVTSFDVPQGATQVTVNTTNNYQADNAAKFILKKEFRTTDGSTLGDGGYRFTVDCAGYPSDALTLKRENGYQWEFTQLKGKALKAGTKCTVKEVSQHQHPNHDWQSVSFSVQGTTGMPEDNGVSFVLPSASQATAVVTATNTYELKKGSLQVTKRVSTNAKDNPWKNQNFSFEADCFVPHPGHNSWAGQTNFERRRTGAEAASAAWIRPVNVKPGTPTLLANKTLPVGTMCLVWENEVGGDVRPNLTWTGAGDNVTYTDGASRAHTTARRVFITADNGGTPGIALTATNDFQVPYGSFKISKKVTGDAAGDAKVKNHEFTFKINCVGLNEQTVKVRPDQAVDFTTYTKQKVKAGTQCRIHEDAADIKGITSQLTAWEGNNSVQEGNDLKITVPAAGEPELTVSATNTVTKDTAKFKIQKLVQPQGTEFNGNFKFTYSCTDPDKNVYTNTKPYGAQAVKDFIEVTAGQSSEEITVPANSKCHVTEDKSLPSVKDTTSKNPLKYNKLSFNPAGQNQTSGEFSPSKNQVLTVSATNHYTPKTTGFQLSKKVTGNNKANHASDTFNFGWSCQPREGKAIDGNVTLADNGSHTVSDLPVGTKCVLWENVATPKANENNQTKWTLPGQQAVTGKTINNHANAVEFTVDKENAAIVVEANNSFDIPNTILTVQKKVVKGDQAVVDNNKEYRVSVSCVYPTDKTNHVVATDKALKADGILKFEADENGIKIPVGASCTVEENRTSAELEGHNLAIQLKVGGKNIADSNANKAENITVPAEGKTVTVENTYNRKLGGFKLTKVVTGEGLDTAEALQANGGKFVFTYDCALGGKSVKTGTLEVTPQTGAEANNIPAGATCTLTEKAVTAPSGFRAPERPTWKVNGADASGVIKIVEKTDATQNPVLEATNTYTPYQVKFNLRKIVNTDDHTQPGGEYGFHVDCGQGATKDVKLNQDNKYTWDSASTPEFSRLSAKSCTVTETVLPTLEGYTYQGVKYSVSDASAATDAAKHSVTFAFPPKGDVSVAVSATNSYRRQQGSIEVEKIVTIADNAKNPWDGKRYSFEADCANPVMNWSDHDRVEVEAGKKGQMHRGRWVGSVCHVWENTADTVDVINQLNWENGCEAVEPYTDKQGVEHPQACKVTIKADSKGTSGVKVSAKNHLTVQYGTFSLAKKLSGDAADDAKALNTDFNFRVNCGEAYNEVVKIKPGATWALPDGKVKVGSTCTVHELPAEIPGLSSTFAGWEGNGYTPADDNGITVNVAKTEPGAQPVVFTANNQADYNLGKFKVRKSVVPQGTSFEGTFHFTYNCTPPAGKTVKPDLALNGEVDVPAGEASAEITVPADSTCTVTEADPKDAPKPVVADDKTPLKYQGTSFQGVPGLASKAITVGKDQVIEFEAVNEYVSQEGGFEFFKSVVGNNASKHTQDKFNFHWYCQARDKQVFSGSQNLSDKGNKKVTKLPVGTKCALWEDSFKKLEDEAKPETKWLQGSSEIKTEKVKDAQGNTHDGVNFEIKSEKDTFSVTAQNKFDIPSTELKVKKLVKADKASEVAAGKQFTVNVTCVYPTDGQTYTIADAEKDGVFKHNQEKTFKTDKSGKNPIPVGAICTVTEDVASADVPGHNWSVQIADGSTVVKTHTTQVKVPKAGKTVTITNDYQRKVGSFKLSKSVAGVDANTALAANDAKFEFKYNCKLDGKPVKDGTISLSATQMSTEITGIPAGAKCVVSEPKVKAPHGYAVPTLSWKLDGAQAADGTATITEGNTSTLDATNTYTPYQVKFDLKKLVKANDQAKLDGDFTFQVSCAQTSVDVTLNQANDYSWDSSKFAGKPILSGETCTIVETGTADIANYNHKSVEYTVSGSGVTKGNKAPAKGVSFTLPKTGDASVSVTATNTYDHQLGSLQLTKAVSVKDNAANPWDNKSYGFTVDCYQPGEGEQVGEKLSTKAVSLKAGETKTVVEKAKVGTVCFVKETVANTPDVTNQLTWENAGTTVTSPDGVANARRVVIAEDQGKTPAMSVTATNRLEVHYGTFTLQKTLTGEAAADEDVTKTPVNFKVKCGDLSEQTVTVIPGGAPVDYATATGQKVKVGTACTVHEVPAKVTGVSSELTWQGSGTPAADNGVSVEIPAVGAPNVAINAVNNVTYNKAAFKIKKTVDPVATKFLGDFQFTYRCVAPNGKVYTQATPFNNQASAQYVSVAAGEESAEIIVPTDSKCTVTEADPQTTPAVDNKGANPVKYSGTQFTPGGKGLTSASFTVTKGTEVVTATAKNLYVPQTTGFQFSKAVSGNNVTNHPGKFNFGYTCKLPNGQKTAVKTEQLGANDPAVNVTDLPVGTECVLWEESVEKTQPSEKISTTWTVGAAKPVVGSKQTDHQGTPHDNAVKFKVDKENEAVSITAENTFEVSGTELTVKKTVTKDNNSEIADSKSFKVSIKCVYPTDKAEHTIATDEPLTNGQSKTFKTDDTGTAIPVGAKCTVTEDETSAKVAGHTWKLEVKDPNQVSTKGLSAEKDKAKNTVELVNDYKREVGGFKLTKAVAGKGIDFAKAADANNGKFEFTYDCVLDGKTVKNGKGKLDLTKDKQTVEVKDIPTDATCTLKETAPTAPTGFAAPTAPTWKIGSTTSDSGMVTIKEGQTAEVVATNTYTPYQVKFTLKKVIKADKALDGDFKFQVTCGDKTQSVTLNKANKYTWESSELKTPQILSGVKCHLEETSEQAFKSHTWKSLDYQVDGKGVDTSVDKDAKRVNFTLPATGDADVTITATNTYDRNKGALQLQKVAKLNGQDVSKDAKANPLPNHEYQFEVTCYDPADNGLGAKTQAVTVPLQAGAPPQTVIKDAPVGSVCFIKETPVKTEAVIGTLSWEGDGTNAVGPDNAANVRKVVIGGEKGDVQQVNVKAVNDLTVQYGIFSLHKELAGDAQNDKDVKSKDFEFTVKCPGLDDQKVTLKGGETKTLPEGKMKVGTKCSVHEVPATVAGVTFDPVSWSQNATARTDGGIDVTIPATGVKDLSFTATNKAVYDKATFQIQKVISSTENLAFEDGFKFTYTCKAPNGKTFTQKAPFGAQTGVDTINVKAGQPSGIITVPQGSKCTVSEANPKDLPKLVNDPNRNPVKYQENGTSIKVGDKTVTGLTSAEFTADGQMVTVSATNTYVEEITGFQFKKTLDGNNAGKYQDQQFSFGYTCKTPKEVRSGDAKLKSADDPVKVENLPVGTECTLWENKVNPKNAEKVSTTWTIDGKPVSSGSVTDHNGVKHTNANGVTFKVETEGTPVNVVATNKFDIPSTSFKIHKTVTNKTDGYHVPADKGFKFDVTCTYPTDDAEHVIAKDELVKGGQDSKNFEADVDGVPIPVGASCTVTEKNAAVANYSLAVTMKDGGKALTVETKQADQTKSEPGYTAKVITTVEAKTVNVENTYTRDFGIFKIEKKTTAQSYIEKPSSFDFKYTCKDPKDSKAEVKQGILNVGEAAVSSQQIPVGYKCEVSEVDPKVKGAKWAHTLSQKTFVIQKSEVQTASLTATNDFTDSTGKFKVTKKVKNDDKLALPLNATYNFEWWCGPKGAEAPQKWNTFSLKQGETFESGEIASGSECGIREVKPTGDFAAVGANVEVTWSLAETKTTQGATSVKAPVLVDSEQAFVFGKQGDSAGKFTIGKNGSEQILTATNEVKQTYVDLSLEKVAQSSNNNGDPGLSVDKFNYWNSYYQAWGGFVTRNFVEMQVTCNDKPVADKAHPEGIWKVPLNGKIDLPVKVAIGSKCTVAELDKGFNDYKMLFYGRWRHSVDMSAKSLDGIDVSKRYDFDAVEDDKAQAAIDFDVSGKTKVEVKMTNNWDCFSKVTSELGTNLTDAKKVNGVRQIDLSEKKSDGTNKYTDWVTLTDVVEFKNLPKRNYTVMGRLFNASKSGKLTAADFNNPNQYLNWKNPQGHTWNYVYQEVNADSAKVTLTYEIPVSLFEANPDGIAAGVAVYRSDYWNPQCAGNCGLMAVEPTLPQNQQVKPIWKGELKTQVLNPVTKSNMLQVGKGAPEIQSIADTVTYTNVAPGSYDLYGRIVALGNEGLVIGEGTANVTTAEAGSNALSSGEWNNDQIKVNTASLEDAVKNDAKGFVTYEFLLPKGSATSGAAVETLKGQAVASHVDDNDVMQQLFTPTLRTTATVGSENGTKTVDANATGTVEVFDKVEYRNLPGGKKYTVTGKLHFKSADGTDGGELPGVDSASGTIDLTSQKATEGHSGTVTLKFTVPVEKLQQKIVVAFEEVKDGNILVAAHADITDEAQTVYSPKIGTTASAAPGFSATADTPATVDMSNAKPLKGKDSRKAELGNVAVIDTVEYHGLEAGKYVLYGELKKLSDGKEVSTAKTSSHSFTVDAVTGVHGTQSVTFSDLKVQSGETYVVYEYLFKAGDFQVDKPDTKKAIASHADPEDKGQTVTVPGVTTDATDGDGDKYVDSSQNFTIKDTVTATGLIPGKTYDVSGELMVDDGTPQGATTGIKQTGTITAKADGTGETVLEFPVTAQQAQDLGLVGKPIVVFEDLSLDGKKVAVHHDIKDEKQTVYNGGLKTKAVDAADENQAMVPGQKSAAVVDTVTFNGRFEKSHSYTLVGELHYVNGTVVPGTKTETKTFQSDQDGAIAAQKMTFTVPAEYIKAGQNMVVFEKLFDAKKKDGTPVASHEDPNDPDQTITVQEVEITTTAYDGAAGDKSDPKDKNLDASKETVTIYDQVDYKGLNVGEEYTITGTLHYQADATLADGTQVKRGDEVPAQYVNVTPVKITANKASSDESGAVKAIVKFEVQKTALATAPVVVFETLYQGTVEVATHQDIDDGSQVVYHPSLRTLATVNGAKVIQMKKDSKENLTVTDQITWANLAPGTYTLEGSLMEVKDGQLVSNTPVAKGQTQKVEVAAGKAGATTSTGEAQMTFKLPVDKVKSGSQFVVYQILKDKSGQVVATHADPKSDDQTVTVGSLDTTATDAADGNKHADNAAAVTINDKVDYSGLNLAATYPDGTLKAYLVRGELMDKATGKPVAGVAPVERVIGAANSVYRVGDQNRPVEEEITSGAGSVVLSFQVPAKLTQGKVLVAFETVYEEGREFLIHHDINDDAQTVYTPSVKTQARVDSERNLLLADKDSTIKDTVTLSGLKTGETYVLSGVLMDKATGQPVLGKDMQAITAVSEPLKAESGAFVKTDAVSFTVPAGTVKADTELVVFEKLWVANEVTVDTKTKTVTPKDTKTGKSQPAASHEDITDENQTVKSGTSPSLKTVLSADGKREWVENNTNIPTVPHASDSLIDTVLYTGLTEGVSYRLDAKLMEINPVTGKVSETPVATGYTEFTAKTSDGTAQVTFNGITGKLKAGYKYVAYEKMTRPGQPDKPVPPPHEDPKDPNQTVVSEHNPGITTTLTDAQAAKGTDGKVISLTRDAQLKDVVRVTQTGLIEGAKYHVFSKLVNQANPDQVVSAGMQEFTATGDQLRSVTVKFTVPKETLQELAGSDPSAEFKLVAYEYLALDSDTDIVNKEATSEIEAVGFKTGKTWAATHADPNDAGQTVTVVKAPKIGTTLKYGQSKTVWVADKVELTDTVEYFNLQPKTKYTLSGNLMGGTSAESLSDTGVKATTEFTTPAAANGAQTVSGTAVVKFTVPREVLERNEKLVAYEYLTIDGNPVASHEDPKDENQTVTSKKPGVGTYATVDKLKAFDVTDGKKDAFTIKDTVRLYNVEEGKTYAIAGQLYEQSVAGDEGSALAKAATTVKVTASMAKPATEVEKTKYGEDVKVYETEMDLTVKREDLTKNQVVKDDIALVVYEQLWAEGTYEKVNDTEVTPKGKSEPVAKHNDPQSSSQSITAEPQFGSLKLTKTVTGWEDAFAKVARPEASYKFTVKCVQKGSVDEFTLKEGEEKTVEGIPLGDTCTISEDVQGAVNQAGLKDTVKFTAVNGVTVDSQVNGEAVVKIGGTANGSDTVANVEVTAENSFSYDPVITTNTISQFGKVLENGGVLTDTVTYKQMPAGNYVLHTYFVEMVKDEATGKTVAKKIDYVPSYVTEQTVKADATTPENGYNGTWTVSVDIPDTLHEVGKKVVVWQDVYVAPQTADMTKFKDGLNKLSAGETSKVAKLVVSHHETSEQQGDGYQWFKVSSNYGSFQVEKTVENGAGLSENVSRQLPKTFKFEYEAKLPAGALLKPGTQPKGEFTLTVDSSNPALAKSPVFEGFPVGTEVAITETGVEGTMPTGATMSTTWATADGKAKTKAWSSDRKSDKVTVKIQPRGLLQVKATNHFESTYPKLATLATTVDGAKMLKPSEATPVLDTVTYSGLVADREYWLLTQLVYTDDSTPVLGADGQPLARWTKVSAGKDGQGTWVVDRENPLVVPETTDSQRDLVFFESLFEVPNTPGDAGTKPPDPTDPSNPPIVEHKDPKDPKQVVSSRPKLEMQTVATIGADVKTIKPGEAVKITDTVSYNGLKAGGVYTLVGKLVRKTDGEDVSTPVTKTGLVADASGSGKWTMDIPLTAEQTKNLKQGDELVVFEKAYLGKMEDAASNPNLKPILAHEDFKDAGQTVTVVETPDTPPTTPPTTPPYTTPPVSPSTTTPPTTPPNPPVSPSITTPPTTPPPPAPPVAPATTIPPAQAKMPPTLARTGAQAALVGMLSLAMIAAGGAIGLLAARRKRETTE